MSKLEIFLLPAELFGLKYNVFKYDFEEVLQHILGDFISQPLLVISNFI